MNKINTEDFQLGKEKYKSKRNSDYILNWIEGLKKEAGVVKFTDGDIRKDFYNFLYDIGYCYYMGNLAFEISDMGRMGKVHFDHEMSNLEPHILKLYELTEKEALIKTYLNSLNRNLFIGAWSTFELCVTLLCDAVASPDEKEKLLSSSCKDIINKFKRSALNEIDLGAFKESSIDIHLTHVPITRKTDLLFKKAEKYPKDRVKEDKEFLLFFGRFRNTMHTNYIYFAKKNTKSLTYSFYNGTYTFENQKIVGYNNLNVPASELFLSKLDLLKEIWSFLISNIEHSNFIPYPDDRQN
ncbi:hypothetical protein CNR22_23905 [Sphingobacteriaceae bacterium]|nr:hypothetical protein CNR22_23905 [Sphingobacteriaceae bacterium]